jgi:hypothetical protein
MERDFKIASGNSLTLKLDEDLSQIKFWENGKQLGNNLDFIFVESDFGDLTYLLARMNVLIKKSGLDRAAI